MMTTSSEWLSAESLMRFVLFRAFVSSRTELRRICPPSPPLSKLFAVVSSKCENRWLANEQHSSIIILFEGAANGYSSSLSLSLSFALKITWFDWNWWLTRLVRDEAIVFASLLFYRYLFSEFFLERLSSLAAGRRTDGGRTDGRKDEWRTF